MKRTRRSSSSLECESTMTLKKDLSSIRPNPSLPVENQLSPNHKERFGALHLNRDSEFWLPIDNESYERPALCLAESWNSCDEIEEPSQTTLARQKGTNEVFDPFLLIDPLEVPAFPAQTDCEELSGSQKSEDNGPVELLDPLLLDDPLAAPPLLSFESLTLIKNS